MGLKSLFLNSIKNRKDYYRYTPDSFCIARVHDNYRNLVNSSRFNDSPHYEWVRNEQLMEYLLSKDYDTFCIGYQILLEKGIIKENV